MATKTARAKKLIDEAIDWRGDGRKTITYEMLSAADFCPTMEYGEGYSDVKFVMKVANQMGYNCRAGMALHLFPKNNKNI